MYRIKLLNENIRYMKGSKSHHKGGPSYVSIEGNESWRVNGTLHREDGPAIINSESRLAEWYINGKFIKRAINYNTTTLTTSKETK